MRFASLLLGGLLAVARLASAQSGAPTDSFDDHYAAPAGVQYRYDAALGQHDYSGNWDFDQDGTPDGLFFVGTGGAHRAYFLRLVLSSDKATRNFPLLVTDLPILPTGYNPAALPTRPLAGPPGFTVFRDAQGVPAVLLCLDQQTYALTRGLLEGQGLRTGCVAVSIAGGGVVLRDYAPLAE